MCYGLDTSVLIKEWERLLVYPFASVYGAFLSLDSGGRGEWHIFVHYTIQYARIKDNESRYISSRSHKRARSVKPS